MNLLIVVFVVACAIVQLPFTEALSPLSSLSYDFDDTFDCFNTTAVVYLESHRRYQLQCTDVTVNRSSIMSSTSIDVRGSASNSTFLSHVHLVVVGNTAPSLSFQNVYYMWNVTVTYLGVDNSQYPLLSSAPNNSSSSSSAEPPPWSQGNDYQPLKAPLLAFSMFNGNHGTHVTVEFVNTTLWCLFQMIRDDVSQNSGTSGGGILTGEFSSWKFVSFYVWNSTMIISIPPTIVTLTSLFYFGHQPPPLLPLTNLHVAISCSDLRMTAALRSEDTDVTIIAIAGTSKLFDSVLRDVMIVVLDSNLVVKLFSTTCVQAAADAGIIMLNLQQEANISVFIARSSVAVVTNYSYSSIVSSCQLFAHSASLVFSGSGPKGNHSTVCIVNMTSVDLAAAGYVTVVQYRTSDPITGFTVVVEGEHSSLGERASPHVPRRCPMKEEVLLHCPPSLLSESSSLCEHSNNNQLLPRSTAGGVNVPIYDSAAAAAAIYRVVAFHFVFLVASRLAALVMIASDAYTSNTTVLVSGVTMWASCLSGNGSALIGSASALVQLGAPTEAPAVIIEVYDSLLIVMLVDGVAPILMSIPFLPNPTVIAFQVAASLVQLAPASSTNKVMWNAAVTVQRCSVSASVGYDVPRDQKITGVLASSVSVLVVSTAVKSSTFVLFENTVNGTDNFASFSQHMSTTSSAPTAAAFLRTVSVLAVCDTSTFAPVVELAKVNSAYVDFLRTIAIDHVVVVIQDTLVTYSGSVVVSESTTATAPSSSSSSGSGFVIVPTDVSSLVMMPSVITHSTITVVNTTAASSSTTTSDTRSNGVSALTALWTASVSQGSSFRFVDCKGLRRLVTVLDGTLKVDLPPPTPAASPPPTQEEMIDQDNLSVFLFHDVETTFLNLSRFDASSSSSSSVVLAPLSVISPLQGLQVPVGVYVVGRSGVSALRSDLSGLSAISTGIVVRLNQTYGSCVASSAFAIRGGSFRGSFDGVVAAVPGVTFQYANGTDVGAGWSSDIGTSPSLAFCRERFLDLTGCTQWQGLPIAKNVVAVGTNRVSLMSHVYVNERCQSSATLSGSLQHIPNQQLALPVAMVSATTPTASLFVASLIIQQLSPVQSANAGGVRSLQGTLMIRRLRALCRISNSAVKGSGSSTADDSSDSESNTNTVNSLCCDLSTSPMQLKFVIGSRHAPSDHTTDISSFVGGVVGNTVLVVGVAVLKMLFARLLRAWNTTKGPSVASVLQQQTSLPLSKSQELALSKANTRSEVNAFLSHAAEVLGEDAPVSAMWPTYTALLTPTISITIGCVVVLALDSTNDVSAAMTTNAVVVCLIGVLWLVVWVGAMIAVVGWRSDASCCNDCTFTRTRSFPLQPAPLRRRSNLGTSSASLCLNVLFEPTEGVAIRRRPFEAVGSDRIWRQHAKSLLAHYGAVFGAYRVSLFWYFNVELLFSFVNGVVGGYAFAEAAIDPCNAIVPWLLVGLGVLEVAVVVVLRPFMVRVDMIALVSVTCISVATGICAIVADDDDELGNILGSLGSAVQLLFLAASVLWAAVQHRCAPRLGASTVLQTLPSNDDDNNHDRRSRADDSRSSLRRTAQLGRNYDHLAKKTQNQDALPQKRLEQLVWIICNDHRR